MQSREYLPFTSAARSLGISDRTLRRRVREACLVVYTDPRDQRQKLLRASDLAQFRTVVAREVQGAEAGKEEANVA